MSYFKTELQNMPQVTRTFHLVNGKRTLGVSAFRF
jgi:hypothetical protein